jgi:uncharacterized protein Usg
MNRAFITRRQDGDLTPDFSALFDLLDHWRRAVDGVITIQ